MRREVLCERLMWGMVLAAAYFALQYAWNSLSVAEFVGNPFALSSLGVGVTGVGAALALRRRGVAGAAVPCVMSSALFVALGVWFGVGCTTALIDVTQERFISWMMVVLLASTIAGSVLIVLAGCTVIWMAIGALRRSA